jgi:hypothetical protein
MIKAQHVLATWLISLALFGCDRSPQSAKAEPSVTSPPTTRPTISPTTKPAATQAVFRERPAFQRIKWEFISAFPSQVYVITISDAGKLRSVWTREEKVREVRESQLTRKQMANLAELFDRSLHQPSGPQGPTDVRILVYYGSDFMEGYDDRCQPINQEVKKLAAAAPKIKRRTS